MGKDMDRPWKRPWVPHRGSQAPLPAFPPPHGDAERPRMGHEGAGRTDHPVGADPVDVAG